MVVGIVLCCLLMLTAKMSAECWVPNSKCLYCGCWLCRLMMIMTNRFECLLWIQMLFKLKLYWLQHRWTWTLNTDFMRWFQSRWMLWTELTMTCDMRLALTVCFRVRLNWNNIFLAEQTEKLFYSALRTLKTKPQSTFLRIISSILDDLSRLQVRSKEKFVKYRKWRGPMVMMLSTVMWWPKSTFCPTEIF